ncbi:MAG: Ribosomal silencing factor RsfA, partial [uncultured Chloroflexia bacterium]
ANRRGGPRQDEGGGLQSSHEARGRGVGLDQPGLPGRCRPRLHRRGPRLLPAGVPLARCPPGTLGGV